MKDPIKLVHDAAHEALTFQIRLGLAESIEKRMRGLHRGAANSDYELVRLETKAERFIRTAEERAELARDLSFTAFRRAVGRK